MPGTKGEPTIADLVGMIGDLTKEVGAAKQLAHTTNSTQQTRMSGEAIADKIAARIPSPAPAANAPMPRWATVTLSVGGGLVTLCTLAGIGFAIVQSYANTQVQGQQVQARLAAMEAWRTEIVALNIGTELQALRQLSRQRDEQIAQLRAADGQTAAETRQLLTAVTQLTTRMDGLLNEMREVKSQLQRGAYLPPRPQSDEGPASYWTVPRGT